MCIFFFLNVEEHQKCFLKARAVRNFCFKGNIDRSTEECAGRNRHDIYVSIIRSTVDKQVEKDVLLCNARTKEQPRS